MYIVMNILPSNVKCFYFLFFEYIDGCSNIFQIHRLLICSINFKLCYTNIFNQRTNYNSHFNDRHLSSGTSRYLPM